MSVEPREAREVEGSLELESNHCEPTCGWILGTEFQSLGRATSARNQRAISPAPNLSLSLHSFLEG